MLSSTVRERKDLLHHTEDKLRTADGEKPIGYILRAPASAPLPEDFERETAHAVEMGLSFDGSRTSPGLSNYIRQARGMYKPDERFAGSIAWHALKGLFWAVASLHAPPDEQERSSGYHAAFGAKAQRHLTFALYHLDLPGQLRLAMAGLVPRAGLNEAWTRTVRGAQAVARIAMTLLRLETDVVLPVSYVDRHYSIDLFCSTRGKDISLQVEAFLPVADDLCKNHEWRDEGRDIVARIGGGKVKQGWYRTIAKQTATGMRMREFNQAYGMDCVPAFVYVPLPKDPPFTPDQGLLVRHFTRFLHEITSA